MHNHTRFFTFIGILSVGLAISSCQYLQNDLVKKTQTEHLAKVDKTRKNTGNYVLLPNNESGYYSYKNIKKSTLIDKKPELSFILTPARDSAFKAIANTEQFKWQFSLQIASVNNKAHLKTSLAALKRKAPNLFQGQFITNVETAMVKNNNFYRLKFGAYKYYRNALADCQTFKTYNLDCLVSNYTDTPYNDKG